MNKILRIRAVGYLYVYGLDKFTYLVDEGGLTIWHKGEGIRDQKAGFSPPYAFEIVTED